jgi:hypothetical protein
VQRTDQQQLGAGQRQPPPGLQELADALGGGDPAHEHKAAAPLVGGVPLPGSEDLRVHSVRQLDHLLGRDAVLDQTADHVVGGREQVVGAVALRSPPRGQPAAGGAARRGHGPDLRLVRAGNVENGRHAAPPGGAQGRLGAALEGVHEPDVLERPQPGGDRPVEPAVRPGLQVVGQATVERAQPQREQVVARHGHDLAGREVGMPASAQLALEAVAPWRRHPGAQPRGGDAAAGVVEAGHVAAQEAGPLRGHRRLVGMLVDGLTDEHAVARPRRAHPAVPPRRVPAA